MTRAIAPCLPFIFLFSKIYNRCALLGNPMWDLIQNSVSGAKPEQLERKISYNKDLFYDVTEDKTIKTMHTPCKILVSSQTALLITNKVTDKTI